MNSLSPQMVEGNLLGVDLRGAPQFCLSTLQPHDMAPVLTG